MTAASSPARWRRVRRASALALGVVVTAALLAIFVLPRVVERTVRARVIAAGERLGRPIHLRAVHLTWLPTPSLTLDGLVVEGARGHPPQLAFTRLTITPDLRPLLHRSTGRPLPLRAVTLSGLRCNLDTSPEGRAELTRMRARLDDRYVLAHAPDTASFTLRDATLCVSAPGAPEACASQVNLTALGLHQGVPTTVALRAAALTQRPNVNVRARFAPDGTVAEADIELAATDPGALLGYLPSVHGGRLDVHRASLNLRVAATTQPVGVRVEGSATLAGLHVEGENPNLPNDWSGFLSARWDRGARELTVDGFHVGTSTMALDGTARVRPDEALPVTALTLRSTGLTLESVVPLVPAGVLPRHSVLNGPVLVRAETVGTTVDASVDLSAASLLLYGLHKPAGMPCTLSARVVAGDHALDLAHLGLVLGPLRFALHGTLRARDDLTLSMDSIDVPIASLLTLAPGIARDMPSGTMLGGAVHAEGAFARTAGVTRANALVTMTHAGLGARGVTVQGDLRLTVRARGEAGRETLDATLDADAAQVAVAGAFDKPAGRPLSLTFAGIRNGAVIDVRHATLTTPGAHCDLHGVIGQPRGAVHLRGEGCVIELPALREVLPAELTAPWPTGVAELRARFNLALRAESEPRMLSLAMDSMSLRGPWGALSGRIEAVPEGELRRVSFALEGDRIDLDAFGTPPPAATTTVHASLARPISVGGSLRVHTLTRGNVSLHDLTAVLSVRGGRVELPTLSFAYAGGHVVGDGSWIEPLSSQFELHARAEGIDLAALATEQEPEQRPEGRAALDGVLLGALRDPTTLAGSFHARLTEMSLNGAWSPRGTVVTASGRALPLRRRERQPDDARRIHVHELTLALAVAHSRVETTEPVRVSMDGGALRMEGSAGFDRTLALHGTYTLDPADFERVTHGQFVLREPLPIGIVLGGTFDAPRFQILDLGNVVGTLFWARIHGIL